MIEHSLGLAIILLFAFIIVIDSFAIASSAIEISYDPQFVTITRSFLIQIVVIVDEVKG
jgi:hypothetical protein